LRSTPYFFARPANVYIIHDIYFSRSICQKRRAVAIEKINEHEIAGEDLFRFFLGGDNDAFERIVAMHEDELFRFIDRIVQDFHEAKHLTIEAFAQLAVGGKKFAGESSLKTYLFTIGKNLAARHMKKRGKAPHIPYEEVFEFLISDDETPHSYMERDENKRLLHDTLQDLKYEYRAVLLLLYFEDMSYRQAGQAMNKSEKQIKHLAFRAKAALKKKLENGGFTYH